MNKTTSHPSPSLTLQNSSWVQPEPADQGMEIQPERGKSQEFAGAQLGYKCIVDLCMFIPQTLVGHPISTLCFG